MDALLPYVKSLIGGLGAFVGAVATGYNDGSMSAGEWWTATGAGLAVVYAVFNLPYKTTRLPDDEPR